MTQNQALPNIGVDETEDARWIRRASIAGAIAWLLSRLAGCLTRVIFFDGAVGDGPFQLFNALRRLAAGQVAGRDFPVFHGLGLPWLHYPLFRLFGQGLFGSELSRQLTSTLLCTAALAIMLRAASGSWQRTAFRLAPVFIVVQLSAVLFGTFSDPGTSMTDLRGVAPLLGATLYATTQSRRLRLLLITVCLGVVPVIAVDQALPFFLAVLVVVLTLLFRYFRTRQPGALQPVSELITALACGLAMALCLMLLISGPQGTLAALKFNFVETPRDQFWFFGAPSNLYYPDDGSYFRSLADLVTNSYSRPILVWLVGAGLALRYLVKRPDLSVRRTGCAILLSYGFLSAAPSLGYLGYTYLKDGTSAMLLALLLVRGETVARWLLRLRKLMLPVLAAFVLFQSVLAAQKIVRLAQAPDLRTVHFSERWQAILTTGEDLVHRYRHRGGSALWTTYSNQLNSTVGEFLPAEDYIIHALGPERRARYLAAFQKADPAVVMTVASPYEYWLQNETWGLYEQLLRRYSLAGVAGSSVDGVVYWVHNPLGAPPNQTTPGNAQLVNKGHFVIQPPGGKTRVGTVSLRYQLRYASDFERLRSKMSRYLLTGDSPARPLAVSLAPYATTWSFPVIATNLPVHFTASTSGIFSGGRVEIEDVSVEWWPETTPVNVFGGSQ